ncbi:MAG: methyltransferase domain-containing protein [Acidobacteria bacterium]|nr:methyltransferase domain-containing protein [Acidobacteriota bacterium]
MPPDAIDLSRRAEISELPELMDEPCSRDVLRHCLRDLARVNRWFFAYRPTLAWLNLLALPKDGGVHIMDVGCGYGDSLRRIEQWASRRKIPVAMTGCDLNPDTIAIAREATPARSRIRWVASDIFSLECDKPVDIIVSSLFTHHLTEPDIIRFIQWMDATARIGWFINDLSRASVPYQLFKAFAKVARLHPFVQHDGPVSIARAFIPHDWRRMCTAAGLAESDIRIQSFTPARLCVGRRKQRIH